MNKLKITYKRFATGTLLAFMPLLASAQEEGSSALPAFKGFSQTDVLLGFSLLVAFLILLCALVILYAALVLKKLMAQEEGALAPDTVAVQGETQSFWAKLNQRLNDAVPLEREAEVMTDHEYDGIHELDNNLPPWWKAMFYATIVFSVVYLAAFHVFDWAPLQDQEYEEEVLAATAEMEAYRALKGSALDETNVEQLTDEAALTEGGTIYGNYCGACHGAELQGGVGPNLADSYWLHGGDVKDVFKTIKVGVPQKGMISWEAQLTPEQIQKVTSFIISKEGSNPANAKEPQGEEFIRN